MMLYPITGASCVSGAFGRFSGLMAGFAFLSFRRSFTIAKFALVTLSERRPARHATITLRSVAYSAFAHFASSTNDNWYATSLICIAITRSSLRARAMSISRPTSSATRSGSSGASEGFCAVSWAAKCSISRAFQATKSRAVRVIAVDSASTASVSPCSYRSLLSPRNTNHAASPARPAPTRVAANVARTPSKSKAESSLAMRSIWHRRVLGSQVTLRTLSGVT
ncbi:hypothetical protein RN50_01484 [Microbacterium foliorum]|uniref:Uncharacterized protein n=1 Tax=Microbacterium foliorum TaxID=104336 RepID=A0A0F0KT14_9MICO|nr:hypothetical protein RN50_01484 [Microbacterium foliorum]